MSVLLFRASSGLLSIQPTVQAEHRRDREVTMWLTRCCPWRFP